MTRKIDRLIAPLAVVAALALPGIADAQGREQGWYLGASLGATQDNETCPTSTCDLKDNGWKVFAGYRLHRNFALEGAYASLGSFKAGGTLAGTPIDVKVDVTSWNAAAMGLLPLGEDRFALFGKAGVSFTKYDQSATLAGFSFVGNDNETELLWGLGASYRFAPNLGFRAEWERFDKSQVDMISLGLQYSF